MRVKKTFRLDLAANVAQKLAAQRGVELAVQGHFVTEMEYAGYGKVIDDFPCR